MTPEPPRSAVSPRRQVPRRRLTASGLGSLPPGEYADPAVPGLQLRVRRGQRSDTRVWVFRYAWGNEKPRVRIGHLATHPLAKARETALALRARIDEGIDPRAATPRRPTPGRITAPSAAADPQGRHTVAALAETFLERHIRPNRKRPEYIEAILQRDVLPIWRGRDARTIEPQEVIALLDGIVDRGSPVMANRTAAVLGQMFRFGIHRGLIKASPVQLLYRPGGKEAPRARVLTDDELRILLVNPIGATRFERLAHVVTALLYTGQRRGELAAAKWTEIDFDAATWTIPSENSKTSRGHVVPLTPPVVATLRALKQHGGRSRYVLPNESGDAPVNAKLLTRSLARCQRRMQKLGIAPFTLHDLRRTCRTGLARLKVPPHVAERVVNHAQEKLTATYDLYAYADEKREALEKWAAHLGSLKA
ncbi:MAG: tyrosine-type recombinase/integrase [Steroidobacteraceae bacterium]